MQQRNVVWLTADEVVSRFGINPSARHIEWKLKSKLHKTLDPIAGIILTRMFAEDSVQSVASR